MRIKSIFASAAALAMIAGAPAYAAKSQNESAASEGGSGAKAKGERKICKTFDSTESRMKREKLCLTREQWRKFEAQQ